MNFRAAESRSDAQLIADFQGGDREAFRPLFERYHPAIYRLCLRICRRTALAEEAAQEAFISAFRGLKGFRGEAQLSTWLYRIAYNASTNLLKRLPPEESTDFDELLPRFRADGHLAIGGPIWAGFGHIEGAEAQALRRELGEQILEAMDRLPEKYRSAFHLVHVEQLANAEAAEVLGISVEALKSRLHRARLYLRERMGRYFLKVAP